MSYSLSQAAQACRVNRTTISRAIKQGKLSATRDAHNHWQVDPAELHRVYPPADARTEGARNGSHYRAHVAEAALNMQVTALKETADLLRDHLDDVRNDRDHWRDQAQAVARQLGDQSAKAAQPAARPWWKRLAG
jgi:Helix-turn-helix domain